MSALPPSVAELSAWVGQTIESDDPRAGAVLAAASALVRGYAGQAWDGTNVPEDVTALVVQVAARTFLSPANPNVKNWNRGPFAEGYFDAAAQGMYLTDEEKSLLNRFRTVASGLGTISTTREAASDGTIYVPTGPAPAGYPFPWYAADGY